MSVGGGGGSFLRQSFADGAPMGLAGLESVRGSWTDCGMRGMSLHASGRFQAGGGGTKERPGVAAPGGRTEAQRGFHGASRRPPPSRSRLPARSEELLQLHIGVRLRSLG